LLLTNTQSEGYKTILDKLFKRPTPDLIEVTYDTDIAARANILGTTQIDKRTASPSEALTRAISEIRAGAVDVSSLRNIAMSASSLVAATSALRRARNAGTGNIGKGGKGILKRSTQRVAGVLAMTAATSSAITGNLDGVHGADPRVVDSVCSRLIATFQSHGAVRLRSPLLRPRPNTVTVGAVGGPAEIMNTRGSVLLLPEDLTGPLYVLAKVGFFSSSLCLQLTAVPFVSALEQWGEEVAQHQI
jgi:hypothetical protein